MAVKSISKKELSAQVRDAVKKVATLKGVEIDTQGGMYPPCILGFVVHHGPVTGRPVGELEGTAREVLDATPIAKGATPAIFIRPGIIICGFMPPPDWNITE